MNASVGGWVCDEVTGLRMRAPDVRLYPIGVPGEIRAALDGDGMFLFGEVPPGEYSLAVYAEQYVSYHNRLTLTAGESVRDMPLSLSPGGFISGQVLDEAGVPALRAWFTLLREGERGGRAGFINPYGDHKIREDGTFCSPPLAAGRYLIRVTGVLSGDSLSSGDPEVSGRVLQQRVFDFLYPDVHHVQGAREMQVQAGQTLAGLQIRIPRPVWFTVRGRVTGCLPEELAGLSILFSRDVGALDQVGGGSGMPLQPDGSFEFMAQQGDYVLEVCEFAPSEPSGRTSVMRRFGRGAISVGIGDLSGVEVVVV